jgi:DNA-binding FadR family transcriptional regulator
MPLLPAAELDSVRASLRRANLHDRIVHELGVRIVRGDFPPGDFLPNEWVLAQEIGVSRNALREAIKVLARKGLVEVRQKIGTRIQPRGEWSLLDREVLEWMTESGEHLHQILDLTEVRLIFEPKASYLAARRASAKEIAAIKAGYEDLESCIGKPVDVMAKIDLVFHGRILAASHNDVLIHLGALVSSLMQIQVATTTVDEEAFKVGLRHHRALAEAIAERNAERAEAASRILVLAPYTAMADLNKVAKARRLK